MNKKIEFALVIFLVLLLLSFLFFIVRPDERFKVQRDARLISDAKALVANINRFFITIGRLPWSDDLGSDVPLAGIDWIDARDPAVGICGDPSCTKPGEMLKAGFLTGFLNKEFISNPDTTIYIARGKGENDRIYACFVPASRKIRQETGKLYKIEIHKPFPPTGTLERCPSYTKWKDNSICYYCVSQ